MPENNKQDVILAKDLRGKWHDIVINIKWSRKKDGHFKQWINGKLVYHYLGNTSKPKGSTNNFKLGIYRGASNETPKESTQIVYYDEIRYAKKSCKKLQLEDLGYSCEELESQKLPNVFILPHLGSATKKTRTDMADLAISNIEEFLKTGKCKNSVN